MWGTGHCTPYKFKKEMFTERLVGKGMQCLVGITCHRNKIIIVLIIITTTTYKHIELVRRYKLTRLMSFHK